MFECSWLDWLCGGSQSAVVAAETSPTPPVWVDCSGFAGEGIEGAKGPADVD